MKDIIKVVDILLPKDLDYDKWSVVACDQYTSEPEYWQQVKDIVKDNKSALNIIYPEVYLGNNDDERISNINANMQKYIDEGAFKVIKDSFIFVDRTLSDGKHRLGLVLAVDLDEYDYSPESKASIKATEGTVIERIPPRVKIRQNAMLELPHIMLLMDDRDCSIIEPLKDKKDQMPILYNFDLMMNGGHIEGYKVENTAEIKDKIYSLLDEDLQLKKYGVKTNILFSVGDGNHSLATAKTYWEQIKGNLTQQERENHPARYALVELVNLHDEGLVFEPIHRVVFDVDQKIVDNLIKHFNKGKAKLEINYLGKTSFIKVSDNAPKAIDEVQTYIDKLVKKQLVKVDYIHGRQNTLDVAKAGKGLAILMPTIKKEELFGYIIEKGVLPRKSFSMGEASDKRYYLEAKLIVPNKEIK